MKTIIHSLLILVGTIILFGCTSKEQVRQAIQDDPSIVLDALAKDPLKAAEVMQKISYESRRLAQEKQEKEELARVENEMKNPLQPKLSGDRAVRGNRQSPILVVEYSDFQCPYCKRGFETVEQLRKEYGNKVLFVFKHLPLDFHPMAMPAAKRFEAIALQDAEKAYRFHDEVFKNQEKLGAGGEKFLDEAAKKVGANVAQMKKDMDSDKVKTRIAEDMAEAGQFGIQGTPGFIVAGVALRGAYPIDSFKSIIDRRGVASDK